MTTPHQPPSTVSEPLFLTREQFVKQLVEAGWGKYEAEQEYEEIQKDTEAGD